MSDLQNVKLNPYYLRKMRTYLKCLIRDGSGIFKKEHLEALADRYRLLANVDTIREKQVKRKFMMMWNAYCEEVANKTDFTPEVFGKCLASREKDQLISTLTHFADMLFDLIDLNADGVISPSEFVILHQLFHLNEETAAVAFKALDKKNQGVIGYEEFSKAVIEYFMPDGEVETETCTIFGPLVD